EVAREHDRSRAVRDPAPDETRFISLDGRDLPECADAVPSPIEDRFEPSTGRHQMDGDDGQRLTEPGDIRPDGDRSIRLVRSRERLEAHDRLPAGQAELSGPSHVPGVVPQYEARIDSTVLLEQHEIRLRLPDHVGQSLDIQVAPLNVKCQEPQ